MILTFEASPQLEYWSNGMVDKIEVSHSKAKGAIKNLMLSVLCPCLIA